MYTLSQSEVQKMRVANRKLAEVMAQVVAAVRVGISTKELDTIAEREIRARGAVPAFLGYGAESGNPFPATICASVNHEIVHGIPRDDTILVDGDIFSVDMGLVFDGFFADMARTVPVGNISQEAQDLITVTQDSFFAGIKNLRAGAKLFDYAGGVADCAEGRGYGVVRDLVSHGIGTQLHMAPQIPNYCDKNFNNFTFAQNMTVALEPMITTGDWRVKLGTDDWTYETADGSLSAHYENTVLITKDGTEILTAVPGESV